MKGCVDSKQMLRGKLRPQQKHTLASQSEEQIELRRQKPQWFQTNMDSNVLELLKKGFVTVLPDTDEEDRICIYHQPSIADPSRHSIEVNF